MRLTCTPRQGKADPDPGRARGGGGGGAAEGGACPTRYACAVAMAVCTSGARRAGARNGAFVAMNSLNHVAHGVSKRIQDAEPSVFTSPKRTIHLIGFQSGACRCPDLKTGAEYFQRLPRHPAMASSSSKSGSVAMPKLFGTLVYFFSLILFGTSISFVVFDHFFHSHAYALNFHFAPFHCAGAMYA